MPSIKDESTIEALARAFTSNGRKQEQAMIDVKYTPAYAKSYCGKMWDNPRLQDAIARIDKEQAEIGHRTVAGLDKLYADCYTEAQANKQPSAMVSAVTGIARLYNMDQPEGKADQPASITEEQAARYRAMADLATADNLNKPKLSKGA